MGRNRRGRGFPDFGKPIKQLLGTDDIVHALCPTQMAIVKPVHIMAGIDNDKRVINVLCHTQRLTNAHRMAELPEQLKQSRAAAFERFDFVQHDHQAIQAAGEQELLQRLETLRRIVGVARRLVEHAYDALGLRNQSVDGGLVCARAFEAAVFGVGQVAGALHGVTAYGQGNQGRL